MSELKNYKKALKSLKINKFDFLKHTINKQDVLNATKQLSKTINYVVLDDLDALEDLIKYENWLTKEQNFGN